ncbi:hypothetical protein NA57DRAFT_79621 [Rhizodiscina lignyota]|uniref:Ankyrin repeat protein n=1 Tax=Rhizodiscina lignyota TaxID=1504668 RepID=A0A9P4I532_9PEZI|nr:hypothetical protein NA57DRAFT_79621 [Rhizodiscina lignyota]
MFFDEVLEEHSEARGSVHEMIYDSHGPAAMLDSVRPIPLNTNTVCQWYHIPVNNMAWAEDLLSELGVNGPVWGGQYARRLGKIPHSRSMLPNCAKVATYDQDQEVLAIFMSYISYEKDIQHPASTDAVERDRNAIKMDMAIQRIPVADVGSDPDARRNSSGAPTRNSSRRNDSRSAPQSATSIKAPWTDSNERNSGGQNDVTATDASVQQIDADDEFEEDSLSIEDVQRLAYPPVENPVLHMRQTLDQSYYFMLENTQSRDTDQVASRWARNELGQGVPHNILMVDQLWLWVIRAKDKSKSIPDIVVSSFPDRTSYPDTAGLPPNKDDNLQWNVLNDRPEQRNPIRTTMDLVSQIVATCSNIFDRTQNAALLKFLEFYEASIGKVMDAETQVFKEFEGNSHNLGRLSERHPNYDKTKTKLLDKLLNIDRETELLREIKDIRDETRMILSVLESQYTTLKDLGEKSFQSWSAPFDQDTDAKPCAEAIRVLGRGIDDFTRMDRHAQSVQDALDHLLDLKQKQANLWEAHSGSSRAKQASDQAYTMLIFTMVTIVFLPLSFMASFFALNVDKFPQDDKGNTNWPLHMVCAYIFGLSLAISVPFIIAAWNTRCLDTIFRFLLAKWILPFGLFLIDLLSSLYLESLERRSETTESGPKGDTAAQDSAGLRRSAMKRTLKGLADKLREVQYDLEHEYKQDRSEKERGAIRILQEIKDYVVRPLALPWLKKENSAVHLEEGEVYEQ